MSGGGLSRGKGTANMHVYVRRYIWLEWREGPHWYRAEAEVEEPGVQSLFFFKHIFYSPIIFGFLLLVCLLK